MAYAVARPRLLSDPLLNGSCLVLGRCHWPAHLPRLWQCSGTGRPFVGCQGQAPTKRSTSSLLEPPKAANEPCFNSLLPRQRLRLPDSKLAFAEGESLTFKDFSSTTDAASKFDFAATSNRASPTTFSLGGEVGTADFCSPRGPSKGSLLADLEFRIRALQAAELVGQDAVLVHPPLLFRTAGTPCLCVAS